MTAGTKKNNTTRNILIGCGVLLLLCVVVGGIAAVATGVLGAKLVSAVVAGPYEIGKRPLPADANQDTLLPATVGTFTRGTVTAAGNAFNATYTSGTDTVTATALSMDSAANAQAAITAAAAADTSLTFKFTGVDPSYASDSATQGQATKLFYSRDKYEFSLIGSSAAALDSFMPKFPY